MDVVEDDLDMFVSKKRQMDCLMKYYPILYRVVLRKLDKVEELKQFEQQCKNFEDQPKKYCLYI